MSHVKIKRACKNSAVTQVRSNATSGGKAGPTLGPETKSAGSDIGSSVVRSGAQEFTRLPKGNLQIACSIDEYSRTKDLADRRLFLIGPIFSVEETTDIYAINSMCGDIVEKIMHYNREDYGLPVEKRTPIKLYINSPGGTETEGYSIVSAIQTSKTPVYTINICKWCSMAFLIGITGHKRFSLPHMQFLLHEGYNGAIGSVGKVQDKIKFDERFENEVIRKHILDHSNAKMTPEYYDSHVHDEIYMLPEDALEFGFIDKIITDLDEIL